MIVIQLLGALAVFTALRKIMRLSDEALDDLRRVLIDLGFGRELEMASPHDLEELGLFLLNLTAAAVKTREKMRLVGQELPPSSLKDASSPPSQATLPGIG